GLVWLGVMAYEWISWAVQGHYHSPPVGPSVVPDWQKAAALGWEVLMILCSIAIVWFFLIRPWRRAGHLTTDRMVVIPWLLMWATQDSWANFSQQYFNYNSIQWNFGCPQCHAPGWQSPNGAMMAEPVVFMPGMYLMLFFGSVLTCGFMRKVRQRYPQI